MKGEIIKKKWSFLIAAAVGLSWATETLANGDSFSVLHTFDVAMVNTGVSPSGSQPDTRPVLGHDHAVYGMTLSGGANGNGVIYRYDLRTHEYRVLHSFSALDANGNNEDGAEPGVALTRGEDDTFYGVAQYGGPEGAGTIFKITASGRFSVLHGFGSVDSELHNVGGANPLRSVVLAKDGNLYGTTRLGGTHTCGPHSSGCGVAWVMTPWGAYSVIHEFTLEEGHAASLYEARDGFLYGCGVYPTAGNADGILYRMAPSGKHFDVLYRFSAVDVNGINADGAECYEPLVETEDGVFFGAAYSGGPHGSGVIFKYSTAKPGAVETVHAFGALDTAGENHDGANPYARLARGDDGGLYSTASYGGKYGSGVVYRLGAHGEFELLHTFSAVNAASGANVGGANPDFGVIFDDSGGLIGITNSGGYGNIAEATGNGTLYRVEIH